MRQEAARRKSRPAEAGDPMSITLVEILIILLLITINGLFSLSEIAVLSARKTRLAQHAENGSAGARTALALLEKPNRFLSTVQIGITLIGILSGALGGAALSDPLAAWIARVPWLAPYSSQLAVTLVVLAITYLSLVLGELVPKRLALSNPERYATAFSGLMNFLSRLAGPVVSLLSASTEIVLRVLPNRTSQEPPVTEEEIRGLMEQGTRVGVFEQAETSMVEGVFRLGGRLSAALVTPRRLVEWINLDDDYQDNVAKVIASPHSYFPVAQGDLDNIIGIVSAKDVLACHADAPPDLRLLAKPALFVPENTTALRLLELLRNAVGNRAMVIDEYGGLLGMVTLYDLMEAIIGEVSPQGGPVQHLANRREDGSWLVDGSMPVDQFKDLLDLNELPEEERVGYQTVAGFMLAQIGSIPRPGDYFEYQDYHFEVVDMDELRVDKILVAKTNPVDQTDQAKV